jgi:hypothetical protein
VAYTLDDPNYLATIGSTRTPIFYPDSVITALTSGITNSYTFPVAGFQFTTTAVSSTNVLFTVLQGGTV